MEFLLQFNCKLVYMKQEDNMVADALSRLLHNLLDPLTSCQHASTITFMYVHNDNMITVCISAILPVSWDSLFSTAISLYRTLSPLPVTATAPIELIIKLNEMTITEIKASYVVDLWCNNLIEAAQGMLMLSCYDGL